MLPWSNNVAELIYNTLRDIFLTKLITETYSTWKVLSIA